MRLLVKEYREKRGLTQVELADKSGVSRGTIWKLEAGDKVTTTLSTICAIAKVLDVRVSDIFFEEDA